MVYTRYNNLLMGVSSRLKYIGVYNSLSRSSVARCHDISKFTSNVNNEKESFRVSLPSLIETVANNPKYHHIPQWSLCMQKLMEYMLTGGKLGRPMTVMSAYKAAENPQNITEESLKRAQTLGWCVEIQNATILILDDIMDGSSTRRGKPCWHTLPDVGMGAIKDAMILNSIIYEILETHFSKTPQYTAMIELFNQTLLNTYVGEHISLEMEERIKKRITITVEEYTNMTKLKTGYCTYVLPLLLGYLLANKSDEKLQRHLTEICQDLGKLYQIQNDALDCFGDETKTGKKGNDIEEGKCTWWFVNAYKLSNAEQRALLVSNYGHNDPARVHTVKQLYKQLNLPQLYQEEEKVIINSIQEKANALMENDRELILHLLNSIYRRTK